MLTGRRFRLTSPTLGLEEVDGKRTSLTIPEGAVIEIKSGPTPTDSRMVDAVFDGRSVVLFAIDVERRGEEV